MTRQVAHCAFYFQRCGDAGPVDATGQITFPGATQPAVVFQPNLPTNGNSFSLDVTTTATPGTYQITLTPAPSPAMAGIKVAPVTVKIFAELPFSVSVQAS